MRAAAVTAMALAGLLGAGAATACEDVPPPPPIQREITKSPHQRWGTVVISTGTRHDGLVSTTPGKPIRILDRKKSTYRDIRWKKIARLAQAPDKEWLEREWRWKEGGSDEKVYTDRYYRAAKYRTVITLQSGETITGDSVAPIYVKAGKTLHRLELHKRVKSPAPATKKELKPLVYITALVLTDKPPEKKKPPASGKP